MLNTLPSVKHQFGFSLLSLVFSITLVAILAALSLARFQPLLEKAQALLQIQQVERGLIEVASNTSRKTLEQVVHTIDQYPNQSLNAFGSQIVMVHGHEFLLIPLEAFRNRDQNPKLYGYITPPNSAQ